MLIPVPKKRLADNAVAQIEELIRNRTLKPGDRLPSERSLIEMLHISRASVREALRILEIKGFIEVKPGSGAYVSLSGGDLHLPLSVWLPMQRETLQHHFEARLVLEPEAASLAALRATAKLKKMLRGNWSDFSEKASGGELADIILTDIEFHRLIAQTTQNRTLMLLMDTIARSLFEGWKGSLRTPNRIHKTLGEHRAILEAIEQGDRQQARQAMITHLQNALADLMSAGLT